MKKIKNKKPSQLKLASMSKHWKGGRTVPISGKHHSQWMQSLRRRRKRLAKPTQTTENQIKG